MFHNIPEFPMLIPGQQNKRGCTQLMRHMQDQYIVLPFTAAPQPADQAAGRDQVIPVLQRQMPAEQDGPDQEIMFFTGQKRHFGRKAGKHAASKIAHPVKQRLIPGSLVLLGIPGKIIQFFRIPVLAGCVKKANSRKACEIFLTGLQLIGT